MKRTQRNLLIILSVAALLWLVLRALPPSAALGIAAGLFAAGSALCVWGRDFLIGRYRMKRRAWQQARASFERFQQKLLRNRSSSLLIPLHLGIYSFDGVAIARNNIGVCLMNLRDLDEAVRWLRSALQRDPLYPVPYINLATIAALRNDAATAQREMRRAVDLGYSPTGAQLLLRRLLARANETAGRTLDGP